MIAKAIKGAGFRGTLEYVHRGGPRIGGNMPGETPRELASQFGLVRALRPGLKVAVLHLPIRPAPGESLTDEEWNAVARRVLLKLGYLDVPYVVYRHGDRSTEHIHVIASRIDYDGRVVSTSNDYFRAMAALREVERDLGLRVVPFRDDRERRPRQAEHQLARRTGEPTARAALQRLIREAAAGEPSVATFLERLRRAGVEVVPNVASTGHVTGLSYRYAGLLMKGSALGRPFTWRGVLDRLGVTYDPARDLPALVAARAQAGGPARVAIAAPPAGEAVARPGGAAAAPAAENAFPPRVSDLTLLQVRRQIRALGASRFDVLALDTATGRQELRGGWTPEQIERALPWLRHRNARGAEILIRPSAPSAVVLGEVPGSALRSASARGLAPAAVTEIAPGRFEVWFRHGEEVSVQETSVLGQLIARELGLSPERSPLPWGHPAGFTSPVASDDASRPRYVRLREHEGAVCPRAGELVELAREAVAERAVREEVAREVEALEELARRHGRPEDLAAELRTGHGALARPPGLPAAEVTVSAARSALDRLRRAEAEHGVAVRDLARAGPVDFPARHEAALDTARAVAAARRDLEELSGLRPLPPLDRVALERWVELRGRLLRTGERLAGAQGVDRYVASLAHRAAAREVEELSRRLGVAPAPAEALARSAVRERTGPYASAYREATREVGRLALGRSAAASGGDIARLREALGRRLAAELPLEAHREALGRAARALSAERAEALARLGGVQAPGEASASLARVERLERRLAVVERAAGRATREAIDRALGRVEERLVLTPTTSGLRDYTRLLTERDHLARQLGASTLPGAGHPRLSPPAAPDVGPLREEVGRAAAAALRDPGPATFAGYREAVGRHLAAVGRQRELGARAEHAAARRELRQVLRETAAPRGGAALPHLPTAIDRLDAARRALAGRLPPPPAPAAAGATGAGRLAGLARRLRLDDSPETLLALRRELLARLSRAGVAVPAQASTPRLPRALDAAAAEFRAARADLLRAARAAAREATPSRLVRLDAAVARYEARVVQLRLLADRRLPAPRRALLRPTDFLRHPAFAGAARRAAAAWAAYAARRGLSDHMIASALAHLTQTRPLLTGARLLTVDDPAFMATLAVFWAARVARRLARDRVHAP